ncbi:MinD/ParA family protein [Aciduricibacillus chroicocephali]|uniref:MinD/ParA family protein n=1 Tax=Aciduricibacillus chroicocephali TaxID=3054939 RepID=A0ABY9KY52_9BACI|nr:MinD/ParA family protein [Bacillaceae bacterium 44XB]
MHDQAENLRKRIKSKEGNTRTISIVSGKGGVGKSNFALNFALALIRQGRKVLVIDLDIGMGNIDVLLGKHSNRSINDLFEADTTIDKLVEEGPEGLQYISGGSGLGNLFEFNEQRRNKFFTEFEQLSGHYDFVIFDMGAGATKESIAFILASDDCILILTPEPTALTDAYGMIKHIINNYGNMPINIVMNRSVSDKIGYKALKGLQEVAKQFLGRDLFGLGIMPEDSTVQKAVMKQMPYLIYKENAAVSNAVIKIAATFLGKPSEDSGSFLSRLMQLVKQRGGGYGNQSSRN